MTTWKIWWTRTLLFLSLAALVRYVVPAAPLLSAATAALTQVSSGSSLPATCVASRNIFLKSGTSAGPYWCSATNTWSGPLATSTTLGATLIESQTLAMDAATVSFTSIPGTFVHLRLITWGRITGSVTSDYIYIQFNGDTGNNYDEERLAGNDATAVVGQTFAATKSRLAEFPGASSSSSTQTGSGELVITSYANASWQKSMMSTSGVFYGTTNGSATARLHAINWRGTSAINRLDITSGTGSLKAGDVFSLYGVN